MQGQHSFGSWASQAMFFGWVLKTFSWVAQWLRVVDPNPYPTGRPLLQKAQWGCFSILHDQLISMRIFTLMMNI